MTDVPTPSDSLTQFEREILEECAGLRKPHSWGAAVGAALDELQSRGLITNACAVTPRGLAELKGKISLIADLHAPIPDTLP